MKHYLDQYFVEEFLFIIKNFLKKEKIINQNIFYKKPHLLYDRN